MPRRGWHSQRARVSHSIRYDMSGAVDGAQVSLLPGRVGALITADLMSRCDQTGEDDVAKQ